MDICKLQDEFLNRFGDKNIVDTIDEAIDFAIDKLGKEHYNVAYDKKFLHDLIKLILLLTVSIKKIQ